MKQFEDFGKSYLPCSAMSVCFSLLNEMRSYMQEQSQHKEECAYVLTRFLNHIGTITTRDFQIQVEDLYQKQEPSADINPNILINVVWNYGSDFVNILHPEFFNDSSIEREVVLKSRDVSVIHDFLTNIIHKNQVDYTIESEQLFMRIYDIEKQSSKRIV